MKKLQKGDYNSKHTGLGREVPPTKEHVLIWFVQNSLSVESANEFYKFYKDRNWLNSTGRCLKNWKMAAWEWIWK